ncbi:hypothetical protein [Pleomorphomonas carboxyditropha]|uniref:Uncharacterized protein n=1 Tax=Pleomorphomonas carboxyditropha TaxID=2023338 RepID=A0A2G9WP09_9HYPH|nr:hypothetical protein [Pleomorphomonas carboxyditropha]PIO96448.1 hypothetical protein CJ014_25400 [Pleomorphomonas carboxyditropha]
MPAILLRSCVLLSVMLLGVVGGHSSAESRESAPPVKFYAHGDGWDVAIDAKMRTCMLALSFDSRGIVIGSFRPNSVKKYAIMFRYKNWVPEKAHYNYEIKNEGGIILSEVGNGFEGGDHSGSVAIGLFDDKALNSIAGSKTLYVTSDGASAGHYDLSGFGKGFRSFFSCLKVAENRKPASPSPKPPRRMN